MIRLPRKTSSTLLFITGVFVIALLGALYSLHFRFSHDMNKDAGKEIMDVIASNVRSSLSLPMAGGDVEGIRDIVSDLVALDVVYAVEVKDAEGHVIVSEIEKTSPGGESIPLEDMKVDLVAESAPIDMMGGMESISEATHLGSVRILFSAYTSTERLERAMWLHAGLIIGLVSIFVGCVLWYVSRLRKLMDVTKSYIISIGNEDAYKVEKIDFMEGNELIGELDKLRVDYNIRKAAERTKDADERRIVEYARSMKTSTESMKAMLGIVSDGSKSGHDYVREATMSRAFKLAETMVAQAKSLKRWTDCLSYTEERSLFDVESVIDRLSDEYSETRVSFRLGTMSEVEGFSGRMVGHPQILIMCVSELISNAIKYGEQSDVQSIFSIDGAHRDLLTVTITDKGPGIQKVKHLFSGKEDDPAQRGFGLAWVSSAIKNIGGRLVIESNAKGTIAKIELPVALEMDEIEEAADFGGDAMIIDDNGWAGRYLMSLIKAGNGRIFKSTREAIGGARDREPAVIMLDMTIRGEDVMESLGSLKEIFPIVPIIITGVGDKDEMINSLRKVGIEPEYVVSKPVYSRELRAVSSNVREARYTIETALGKIRERG
jgi:two-component sensor histidine kinase